MSHLKSPALCLIALLLAGCGRVPISALFSDYERQLDSYDQVDITETDVTTTLAGDGREVALVSAFYGLDDDLPFFSGRFICEDSGNKDGMPVIFSHEVDPDTVEPGDFSVTTASGQIGEVTCLTLAPADDKGELRTVLLVGQYGSIDDQPARVEIVGNILSADRSANFKGTSVEVIPLEAGPTLVWAEVVPPQEWALDQEGTALPFGGGSGCPEGTQQIVRATWTGGITKPNSQPADDVERLVYKVTTVGQDGTLSEITPFALADLGDGDNNHKLCLDSTDQVTAISFAAGYVTDPRDDLNPETSVSIVQ
ncbi:MAG: hypothetical protein AAGI44_03770 [Pseudomonadota bacterium]